MARALIVVDVQNDFCEGGSLPVRGGAEVAFRISQLLRSEHDYAQVIASRDHHVDPGPHFSADPDYVQSWPAHCVAGTDGAAFHPNLDPQPFAAVFDKGSTSAAYSGFEGFDHNGTPLASWLEAHHIHEVDVVGLATDYCVRATALDAAARGLRTRVLLDMTAAVDPTSTAGVLADLSKAGVELVGTLPKAAHA